MFNRPTFPEVLLVRLVAKNNLFGNNFRADHKKC